MNVSNFSDSDIELCARWIQLSTFSPLFIVKTQPAFDNIFLSDDFLDLFESTLELRVSMIPHMYAILLNSSRNASLINPVFFSFPNDTNLFNYSNLSNNEFMLGKSLLITPVIEPNVTSTNVYFPSANWYFFSVTKKFLIKIIYEFFFQGTDFLIVR